MAERIQRVDEHDVEIPLQPSMLKRVVGDDHGTAIMSRVRIRSYLASGEDSVPILNVRCAGAKQFQDASLVVSPLSQFSITAADDARTVPRFFQHADEHRNDWRLAGATRRQIANADHWNWRRMLLLEAEVEQRIPKGDAATVAPRKHSQQSSLNSFAERPGRPSEQLQKSLFGVLRRRTHSSPLKKCATGSASDVWNRRLQEIPHWQSRWRTWKLK